MLEQDHPAGANITSKAHTAHRGIDSEIGFSTKEPEGTDVVTIFDLDRPRRLPKIAYTLSQLNAPGVDWLNGGGVAAPFRRKADLDNLVAKLRTPILALRQ